MKNRWVVLAAVVVLQTILGGIYAWSVFTPPLQKKYGLSAGQTGLIFGLTIIVFTLAMLAAGQLLQRKGPRITAMLGSVLFVSGYLLASAGSGSFLSLIVGIGFLAGAGLGFGYVSALTVGMEWFPKNKGLISGVSVAGFGAGAILLSKIAMTLMSDGVDVLRIFLLIGAAFGGVAFLASATLSSPNKINNRTTAPVSSVKLSDFLFSRNFLILFGGMLTGTFVGLLVVGNLKPIGLSRGAPDEIATLAIIVFAIGNASGRIVWGYILDRFGRRAIPGLLFTLAIGSFGLLLGGTQAILIAASLLIGFGFGGNFALYPASVANLYGTENVGSLYPKVFFAYGISGIVGVPFGGWVFDRFGTYAPALIACGVAALFCGILLSFVSFQKESA